MPHMTMRVRDPPHRIPNDVVPVCGGKNGISAGLHDLDTNDARSQLLSGTKLYLDRILPPATGVVSRTNRQAFHSQRKATVKNSGVREALIRRGENRGRFETLLLG
jgi:hypothetical protein